MHQAPNAKRQVDWLDFQIWGRALGICLQPDLSLPQTLLEERANLLPALNTPHFLAHNIPIFQRRPTNIPVKIIQQFLHHLHHSPRTFLTTIYFLIARRQVFDEVDTTRFDDRKQSVEGRDLLVHEVSAVIDDHVKTSSWGWDEPF